MLTHLDLFSGIGGFALACEWAGIETIGFVEIDKYCQKVLRKHWPSVPIVEDIRDVEKIKEIVANATGGRFQQCEVWREKANDFSQMDKNGRNRNSYGQQPAILVTAGFPCQPFSVAGKRGSKEDDRYLWPETLAVIKAVKPAWVLLENVTGIINLALDTVLSDLEGAGYSYETLIIPACAVNAPHRRDRVWVVAYNKCLGWQTRAKQRIQPKEQITEGQDTINIQPFIPNPQQSTGRGGRSTGYIGNQRGRTATAQPESLQSQDGEARSSDIESCSQDVAYSTDHGCNRNDSSRDNEGEKSKDTEQSGSGWTSRFTGCGSTGWWAVESDLGRTFDGLPLGLDGHLWTDGWEDGVPRVATGIKNRVDQLKCLGNAIVPQVAYEIIRAIKETNKKETQ